MLPGARVDEDSPTTFGRFLLVERLAAGGMAEVYASRPLRRTRLPRVVAIKRMLPDIAARGDFIDMFVDEAKLVSRLNHENIVRSYEYGREAGAYYIAMEMLSGLDMSRLASLVSRRRRRIPPEIAAYVAEQVCAGLAHAHALEDERGEHIGLIHRDITPHNLIVGFDGTVKIIDFGIAKSAIQRAQTTVGMLKGKVCYMSPEQATRTARIDYRSDIYSTGVCLWEWLAGRRMFSPDLHFLKTLKKVRGGDFKPIDQLRPGLPDELVAIVNKALAKKPRDRFQSAEEMREALEAYRAKRCSMPKRALRRWLDRELADQRMKAEQQMQRIGATPVPEGTIAYHPELELVATEQEAKDGQSSFVEAATEVFFSVDIDIDVAELAEDSVTSAVTDFDVELPSWSRDTSGIQTKVGKRPRRPGGHRATRRAAARAQTTTLVDESPWWQAYAEISPPSDWEDAETKKHIGTTDETPRLIDTLRPQEQITKTEKQPAKTRRAHPALLVAAALAAAAILGAGVHFAERRAAAAADAGVLQVRLSGDAESATVFVDGVERGMAPLTLGTLSAGRHDVRVVAEGFRELAQRIEVEQGATTIVAASLAALEAAAAEPEPEVSRAAEEGAAPAEADDGAESPALTAAEAERQARQERWERLLAIRAARARRAERRAAAEGLEASEASSSAEASGPAAPNAEAAAPTSAPTPAPAPRPEPVAAERASATTPTDDAPAL